MIGKNMTYNGQAIATTTDDFQIGLTVSQWKTLDVSDEQQNVQGYHGIRLSPTFARGRRITLEGLIIADDHIGSSKGIDYLEALFALQGVPDVVDLLPFTVTDEQDRVWRSLAKIKEPVSIELSDDDHIQGTTRRWRVVLQAEDPRFYSSDEYSQDGAEWHYGWFKLGHKLGAKFNEYFNEIQVSADNGNIDTPLVFTITATGEINAPLLIKNLTDGSFFGLDIDAVDGDVIVVDANNYKATKNGVNIKATRMVWSTWPRAKGLAKFSIFDNDGWLFASDFEISVTWRNILL